MKDITVDIWRERWYRHINSLADPYKIIVLKHLCVGWGVYNDYLLFFESPYTKVYPEDISVTVLETRTKGQYSVTVNHNNTNILKGWLVDNELETQEYWEYYAQFANYVLAYVDKENGISLYI
jgi:hypothetical protein